MERRTSREAASLSQKIRDLPPSDADCPSVPCPERARRSPTATRTTQKPKCALPCSILRRPFLKCGQGKRYISSSNIGFLGLVLAHTLAGSRRWRM
ncbi:hypothetical protein C2845_PM02G21750 [Panicum miliaceum]|uniref:Uncharacterized protein n=1 Tax=Panicum miliaceum TaxID=4540 RepID=A0A3L6S7H9_PANMI|nr:hypothetical protein C2845_PM02G21750 [Panicum miliaceum]